VTPILAGLRFQFWWMRGNADGLQAFVLTPLYAIIFGSVAISSGRRELLPELMLGAALMGLWTLCVQIGGSLIQEERRQGTLEPVESTPAHLGLIIVGRVTALIAVAVLVFPEIWLIGLIIFGELVTVHHPQLFAVALLLTLVGLHASANLFAGLFVLARNAVIIQNALVYPIFLLGGLIIPASVLPEWLQPLCRLIFLSWGSDLLRASLRPEPVASIGTSITGLCLTSAAMVVIGQVLMSRVIHRARVEGTLSLV
jgi:ABC-2 type transport system permease protein